MEIDTVPEGGLVFYEGDELRAFVQQKTYAISIRVHRYHIVSPLL